MQASLALLISAARLFNKIANAFKALKCELKVEHKVKEL
jgi:hypothetical protein